MRLKDTGLTAQDIKDKVSKYMIETYERFDFLAETAEGMYLYDENGTPYLDFYAGIAVNNAGNRNPKVVAAVKDQVDDIMHTFNYPYTIPQALLAEKVCKTLGMDKIFYQNSGTEANEAMIKMARKYGIEKYGPNRYHIVTAGSHGTTFGGHPISCAAALAEVGELLDRDLAGNAKKVGDYFAAKLEKLPHVKEVRHQGLLVGVEFDDTISGVDVKHGCFDRKLLITAIGAHIIRMVPPLIVSEEECDKAVEIIEEAVKALS